MPSCNQLVSPQAFSICMCTQWGATRQPIRPTCSPCHFTTLEALPGRGRNAQTQQNEHDGCPHSFYSVDGLSRLRNETGRGSNKLIYVAFSAVVSDFRVIQAACTLMRQQYATGTVHLRCEPEFTSAGLAKVAGVIVRKLSSYKSRTCCRNICEVIMFMQTVSGSRGQVSSPCPVDSDQCRLGMTSLRMKWGDRMILHDAVLTFIHSRRLLTGSPGGYSWAKGAWCGHKALYNALLRGTHMWVPLSNAF
jgi:hypothetical protein